MNGFSVGQKNHTKKATVHFRHLNPPSDAPVRLDVLPNRRSQRSFNPLVSNQGPIGALSKRLEVGRDFHCLTLPEGGETSKSALKSFAARIHFPRHAQSNMDLKTSRTRPAEELLQRNKAKGPRFERDYRRLLKTHRK